MSDFTVQQHDNHSTIEDNSNKKRKIEEEDIISSSSSSFISTSQLLNPSFIHYPSLPSELQSTILSFLPFYDLLNAIILLNHEQHNHIKQNTLLWQNMSISITDLDIIHQFDRHIKNFLSIIPCLQSLHFQSSHLLSFPHSQILLPPLCLTYRSMTSLKLYNIAGIDDECITIIVHHMKSLQTLHIDGPKLQMKSIVAMFSIATLTDLYIPAFELQNPPLTLTTVPALTAFLSRYTTLPPAWWRTIFANSSLISLSSQYIPPNTFRPHAHRLSTTLSKLCMYHTNNVLITFNLNMLTPPDIHLTHLEALIVDDHILLDICKLTSLTTLRTYNLRHIIDRSVIQQLASLPLKIDHLTTAGLQSLTSWLSAIHTLQELHLCNNIYDFNMDTLLPIIFTTQPQLHTLSCIVSDIEATLPVLASSLHSHRNIHTLTIQCYTVLPCPPAQFWSLLNDIAGTTSYTVRKRF